jgi:hypothetical protein
MPTHQQLLSSYIWCVPMWQSRMAEVWKSPIPLAGRLLHPRYYFWYYSYLQHILVQIPELHRYVLSIPLSGLLTTFFLPLFFTDLIPCLASAQPAFNGLGVILFRFLTLLAQCKFSCCIHISRQVPSILRASTSHILFGISELRARTSFISSWIFLDFGCGDLHFYYFRFTTFLWQGFRRRSQSSSPWFVGRAHESVVGPGTGTVGGQSPSSCCNYSTELLPRACHGCRDWSVVWIPGFCLDMG